MMKLPLPSPKLVLFYGVTVALTVAAITLGSALFAFAAVTSLVASLIAEAVFEKLMGIKNVIASLSPEDRRKLQDLEARVVTIEHGIRIRGY